MRFEIWVLRRNVWNLYTNRIKNIRCKLNIKQETIKNREDGTVDVLKLHEALIAIKQKFPTEEKIILVPQKATSYDTIVMILDAAKAYEKTDPVIVVKNEKTGVEEQSKNLFGEVVFGNLLGDD